MATLQIIAYDQQTLTLFLSGLAGATGTPVVDGYGLSESETQAGLYSCTVSGLAGEFYAFAKNEDDDLAFVGYFTLANDSGTYRSYDYQVYADAATIEALTTAVNAVKLKTDTIGIGGTQQTGRPGGATIVTYVGEVYTITLPTDDFTSNTLSIVWETRGGNGTDVAEVVDDNCVKTSTTTAFAIPSAVAATAQRLSYAIRDTANGDKVLAFGEWRVETAPQSDT